MKVPLAHFGEEMEDLWGDPAETATLSRLRSLIAGGDPERRPYQAPVSFRILPRVLAQYRRAVEAAEATATTSLRAITDNPVFLPAKKGEKPQVFSTGGYHNAMAYPAMDNIAAAMADISLLADRHTSKLLDAKNSLLPDQLQKGDGYLGCLGMVQVGYAEQARRAAQRNFLPGSEGGGFGQNDVAPPSFFSWRAQDEAGRCLEAGLAMLGVVASQAFFVTDRSAPPALADLLALVRSHVRPLTDSRVLADELAELAAALRARVYDVAPALKE
jgi:histidine ammonia-lyase